VSVRTTAPTLATIVAIAIGGVVVTRAQQAPEQLRVPGIGRTIPGDRGVIGGHVVDAGTGRPIAAAKVDVRGASGQEYVTTDEAGRYETPALVPGTYSITVTAPDHAVAFYNGATGSKSVTLDVRPGSRLTGIDVAMYAMTPLSGRILDDRGRGLAGASIQLVAAQGSAIDTFPRAAYAQSDSDGRYRLTAAPGDYVVRASVDTRVRPSRDAAQAYVATFFPGVSSQDAAQVIRLGSGVEQYDVDFALLSSRTVRVAGTVIDPAGTDLEDVTVSLRGFPAGPGEKSVALPLTGRGEFDTRDVVPGTYIVDVIDPRRPSRWKVARDPIEIAEDVTGLEIRAAGAASISGRIVRDARSTGRPDLTQVLVTFVNRGAGIAMSSSLFNTEADGSFHGDLPAGSLSLMLMGPREWTTRAVRLDGVDVFGMPLELTPGAHEIEVVVTDHLGSVDGLVVDRRGTPRGGVDVVLFPQDERRWHFASPLIRQTRSSQNGRFEVPLLPPGDYVAVATEGVPFLMLGDPEPTLRRLQSSGTRLKIGDDEQKTISIRASPAP